MRQAQAYRRGLRRLYPIPMDLKACPKPLTPVGETCQGPCTTPQIRPPGGRKARSTVHQKHFRPNAHRNTPQLPYRDMRNDACDSESRYLIIAKPITSAIRTHFGLSRMLTWTGLGFIERHWTRSSLPRNRRTIMRKMCPSPRILQQHLSISNSSGVDDKTQGRDGDRPRKQQLRPQPSRSYPRSHGP